MTIRVSKKQKNEVSLQEPIGVDKEGNEIALIDIISSDNESIVDEVNFKMQVVKLYEEMKKVLKQRERLVIELRYGLVNGTEMTQKEIADMLGISRSYVSRIEKRQLKN